MLFDDKFILLYVMFNTSYIYYGLLLLVFIIDDLIDGCIDDWIDECIDDFMDDLIDECMDDSYYWL